MKTVHVGFRCLLIPAPAVLFAVSDKDVAEEAQKEHTRKFQAIAQARLVLPDGQDTGLTLGEFLGSACGVQSVSHPVGDLPVRDSNLVVAENRIIRPH